MRLAIATGIVLVMSVGCGAEEPGEPAFYAADAKINVVSAKTAFGNGPEAEKLAERFGTRIKLLRQIGFSQNKSGPPIFKDDFLTFCQLTETGVLFLIHVPELRNFKEDAQATLLDLAWMTARTVIEPVRGDRDLKLAIGLRGSVFYGGYAIGSGAAEKPEDRLTTGVISTAKFFPFFIGAYPKDITLADDAEPAAAAAGDPPAAGEPAKTATELVPASDPVASHIALIEGNTPSTAVAVAPDLFATSEPLGPDPQRLRLAHGPAFEAVRVGAVQGGDLVLLRPRQAFKFEPIALSATSLVAGDQVTAYFAEPEDRAVKLQRFTMQVRSLDKDQSGGTVVHTDERLNTIGFGGPLVDSRGRLAGVASSGANVYIAATQVQQLIETVRKGDAMKRPQ